MSSGAAIRVIHVFPNAARLSCGPCNAIMAFMECQMRQGLDVRAVGPVDSDVPPARQQPVDHLPLLELDVAAADFDDRVLAGAGDGKAVFHFHGISPWSEKLARRMKQMGRPYVFTSHGQLNFYSFIHGFKKSVYLNLVSPFIRDARGLHFLTHREQARFKWIMPLRHQVDLVQPNLVSLPDDAAVVPVPRQDMGLSPDAFVFAFLGRLDVRNKGLDVLLKAFAPLSQKNNAGLVLIGPDFEGGRDFLVQLARQLGCDSKVFFAGPRNGLAKWEALKTADAFVFPSRWEAFGIALAEAAGIGLPVIVSNQINVVQDLAAHGAALSSPLTVDGLGQAMHRVLAEPQLRESLAAAGRRWARETCSAIQAGPRFETFYRTVVGFQ